MMPLPITNLHKWGLAALLLAAAFAAGRFSVKEKKLSDIERQSIVEHYEQTIQSLNELHKREIEEIKSKTTETEKVTEIDKDGNTKITEKTKTKEDTKTTEKEERKVEVRVETVVVEKIVEKTKEVVKIIPPPDFRVYGAAALSDPTREKVVSYGAGISYDLGFMNVGTFGMYAPNNSKYNAVGLTAGISF